MSSKVMTLSGKLPQVAKEEAGRISAYLVSGDQLLSEATVQPNGSVQFHVASSVLEGTGNLRTVVGPAGLSEHALIDNSGLPAVAIDRKKVDKEKSTLEISLSKIELNKEIIEAWWLWCRQYCVNGTVVGPDGCIVPGAQVTVYTVSHAGVFGFNKTTKTTVTTDAAGKFQACFNWCTCRFCIPCWPCRPFWWLCWPWWWELDILHLLESIEGNANLRATAGIANLNLQTPPLSRPSPRDLQIGQGFAAFHKQALVPDENRTRVIQRKLADPLIRKLFPWWLWCCDEPNILFSVSQNSVVVLNENPATDTRWCLPSGSSETLVGDSSTITICDPNTPPPEGFTWIQVGNILVSQINQGYAIGATGTDASDMAFAGDLLIHGSFSSTQGIAFYNVLVGQWGGTTRNSRRGGTAPGSFAPFSGDLLKNVSIFRAATSTVNQIQVKMGPCSFAGRTNLYVTEAERPNVPGGVVGLDPFPILHPGDFIVGWSDVDVKVHANAAALVSGSPVGAVDLTMAAYDISGNPVPMVTNLPLTLMMDTMGISATIDGFSAFDSSGNPVNLATGTNVFCPAYDIGNGGYVLLHVNVTDPNLHLAFYEIDTEFGHGGTTVLTDPTHRGYSQSPASFTSPSPGNPQGVDSGYLTPDTTQVAFGGGGDTIKISPTISCCYDFRLNAGKRVTDGQSFFSTSGNYDFQTASINVDPKP
jgi:hypothetical protein